MASSIRVAALYRYPVKSMVGERLDSVAFTRLGPVGDRNWAVIDRDRSVIRSAKRWPSLLLFRAQYATPPTEDAYDAAVSPVLITAPDGDACRSDDPRIDAWLSDRLERPASLSRRRPASDRDHYRLAGARSAAAIAEELNLQAGEVLPDFGAADDPGIAELQAYATPPGSYVDAFPIHVLTQTTLDTLAAKSGLDTAVGRFRPNLLLETTDADAFPEQGWVGRRLRIGDAVIRVQSPTLRCAMPARPQPLLSLAAEPTLTRALVDHCRRYLGVNAIIEQGGAVRVGDRVTVA